MLARTASRRCLTSLHQVTVVKLPFHDKGCCGRTGSANVCAFGKLCSARLLCTAATFLLQLQHKCPAYKLSSVLHLNAKELCQCGTAHSACCPIILSFHAELSSQVTVAFAPLMLAPPNVITVGGYLTNIHIIECVAAPCQYLPARH